MIMTSKGRHQAWISRAAIALVLAVTAAPLGRAQTFTVIHSFQGGADGEDPFAALILDKAGNLYGTTSLGGSGACSGGCGTIFEMDSAGNETILYNFTGAGGDGRYPYAPLARDKAGNLYGTTYAGGNSVNSCNNLGCGAVFKLNPAGKETVLYSFTGGADGAIPYGGLVLSKGAVYGTTYLGGVSNWGTVFSVDNSRESVLTDFAGATGGDPSGGLIQDSKGNFYGVTEIGGNNGVNCHGFGCGTIFQIAPNGTETVLYYFTGQADGNWPGGENLVRDAAGNLYGTSQGGSSPGWGTVFKLAPNGRFTVLHAFTGGSDGGNPWAGLVQDSAGNLYGTAATGGGGTCYPQGCGTVFRLSAHGKFTVLHSFTGDPDGAEPRGALVLDSAGNLYGTTLVGGLGDGTVFKITR